MARNKKKTTPFSADDSPYKSQRPVSQRYLHSRAGERVLRWRKERKAVILVGIIGTLGLAFLSIYAFLGQVSNTFSVSVDPRATDHTLQLTNTGATETEEPVTWMKADGMRDAWNVDADSVMSWVKQFYEYADQDIQLQDIPDSRLPQGSAYYTTRSENGNTYFLNMYRLVNGQKTVNARALMYSFYVTNSDGEEVNYNETFTITNYRAPSNGVKGPYEYLRIAFFENDYHSGFASEHNYKVYALEQTASQTLEYYEKSLIDPNTPGDYRECISNYTEAKYPDGNTYRTPSGNLLPENNDYCEPFTDSKGTIFSKNTSIKGYGTKRYTIVAWLEGYDRDCINLPDSTNLTFDLTFSNL